MRGQESGQVSDRCYKLYITSLDRGVSNDSDIAR